MDIVLATRNRRKAEEVQRILSGLDVNLLTLDDFPDCPDVVEDAETFEGNAAKKARAVAAHTGMAAVADDSGLEVYSLGGGPGVLSARYAGEPADDAANMTKLLGELGSLPPEQRGGRFVCSIALSTPAGEVVTFWGTVEGRIGPEPRGHRGFGYDPLFFPAGYEKTFAEMSPEEKDRLSHRSAALGKLKAYLKLSEK